MFHVNELIRGAEAPTWRGSAVEPAEALVRRVRNSKRGVAAPGIAALWFPSELDALAPLLHELQRIADDARGRLDAAAEALLAPRAVLPGRWDHSVSERDYYLVAVTRDERAAWLSIVTLRQRSGRKAKHRTLADATIEQVSLNDSAGVRDALERLYMQVDQAPRFVRERGRASPPRGLWVGRPPALTMPDGWDDGLRAIAAGYGYQLTVLAEASLARDVTARIRQEQPELLVVWQAGVASAKTLQRVVDSSPGAQVALLDAVQWEDALDEFRVYLEAAEVTYVGPPEPPASVHAAVLTAIPALSSRVTITSRALRGAKKSPYRHPEHAAEGLQAVDAVATEWADGSLRGGFEAAFTARGFDFAPGVSSTALQAYRDDYRILWHGAYVLLGPHLRWGAGAADVTLRMYWYVDETRRVFVVGHIGEHLRDAGS